MFRKKRTGKLFQKICGLVCVLFVFVCYQNMTVTGKAPAAAQLGSYFQGKLAFGAWQNCMPSMLSEHAPQEEVNLKSYVLEKLESVFPVYGYTKKQTEYSTQIESSLSCETVPAAGETDQPVPESQIATNMEMENQQTVPPPVPVQPAPPQSGSQKAVEIAREKLNDFDYLIQNFYQVDRTTTIDGSQLNADALLGKSMKIVGDGQAPQILIYHTHSQEGYSDSTPGDSNTSIVGVGEYLTTLLRQSGLNVIHHTGEYDVGDRDNAYSNAEPGLEKVLAENPSIEVVIDLHRDGVGENTRLVSEVNGKQTAKIMFFNGLSRTTKNGDIGYLANPNLADNLAFSFQMKLAAEEYYPGFTRPVYLKAYRYNLHYCPKSILIEVGAQTNTLQEAMNAMEPLADLLHRVLTQ